MTVIPGAPSGRDGASVSSRPATRVAHEVPVRAEGVQLIGEMQGSGYREPPSLVRRSDGQTIQLTKLLYLVLQAVDGRRTHEEIAGEVSSRFGRRIGADDVHTLVDSKLRPLGVLLLGDGSQPEVKKSNPLLALRFRCAVTDPEKTRRLTAPFAWLFQPVLVFAVVAAFGAACWWVFFEKGLASATHEAFEKPALLLLIFVVSVLSAGFHEFGHASAARYGGATPGVMGMGHLPRLAGVLHRRHRLLPARPQWPRAHGPRRAVLQRARRRRHRRRLVGQWVRRAAARRRHPDPADGSPAAAAGALRRLPRARRRHRCPGPVPPDQAHAARPAPVALARPGAEGAQAVGAGRGHGVGAHRRTPPAVLRRPDGPRAPAGAWHRLGQRAGTAGEALDQLDGRRLRGRRGEDPVDRRDRLPDPRHRLHPQPTGPADHRLRVAAYRGPTGSARHRGRHRRRARGGTCLGVVAGREQLPADPALRAWHDRGRCRVRASGADHAGGGAGRPAADGLARRRRHADRRCAPAGDGAGAPHRRRRDRDGRDDRTGCGRWPSDRRHRHHHVDGADSADDA